MLIWPPSPGLRQDTTPTSHRTRFPVNARGDMASAPARASVPPLPSVPLAGARRRSRMRTPGAVADYPPSQEHLYSKIHEWITARRRTFGFPASGTPAPPLHRSCPRIRTPRTVTATLSSPAVSATLRGVASNDTESFA